jgi:formylglycine-generating enzyme
MLFQYPTVPHSLLRILITTLCLSAGACSDTAEPLHEKVEKHTTETHNDAMVYIPAGEFHMGADGTRSLPDERPMRTVFVSAFYIDRYEVTNADYQRFVLATGHAPPHVDAAWAKPFNWNGSNFPAGTDTCPVVLVSWHDAAAYAAWAGKRLPTEAEWEKAARGGLSGKQFPHGERIELNQANYFKSYLRRKKLYPVGSFTPNTFGLHDMAGNAWEWCGDWYGEDHYRRGEVIDPVGPLHGHYKVLRGGSWMNDIEFLRCARRGKAGPDHRSHTVGFRCVKPTDQSPDG